MTPAELKMDDFTLNIVQENARGGRAGDNV
jgi:hypothetical protein